ncbi:MAG TPA: sarcosine oxidase subunit delta [Devosia sp.]|nr:sarcosine oxidase subunit delta [Devosia sp.]
MLLIHCPCCKEARPEIEFLCKGEAYLARPHDPDDAEWEAFLYLRRNPRGLHMERWVHVHGCGRFFNAVRHTVQDRILATSPAGTPPPDLDKLQEQGK